MSIYFPGRASEIHVRVCVCGQSAETGQRYEYELECQAGRAAAGWPPAGDHRRPLRDPHAAAGAHQERRVLPERGQRGQTGHGRDQGTPSFQRVIESASTSSPENLETISNIITLVTPAHLFYLYTYISSYERTKIR